MTDFYLQIYEDTISNDIENIKLKYNKTKKALNKNIDKNIEIARAYKADCILKIERSDINQIISVVTLMFAVLAIMLDLSAKISDIEIVVLVFVLFLYLLLVTCFSIIAREKNKKYKYILSILNDIETDLNNKK